MTKPPFVISQNEEMPSPGTWHHARQSLRSRRLLIWWHMCPGGTQDLEKPKGKEIYSLLSDVLHMWLHRIRVFPKDSMNLDEAWNVPGTQEILVE